MATDKSPHRSSLGLIVLFLLWEEPMHVYRMQKMIEAQGKNRVVNVRSGRACIRRLTGSFAISW